MKHKRTKNILMENLGKIDGSLEESRWESVDGSLEYPKDDAFDSACSIGQQLRLQMRVYISGLREGVKQP